MAIILKQVAATHSVYETDCVGGSLDGKTVESSYYPVQELLNFVYIDEAITERPPLEKYQLNSELEQYEYQESKNAL